MLRTVFSRCWRYHFSDPHAITGVQETTSTYFEINGEMDFMLRNDGRNRSATVILCT